MFKTFYIGKYSKAGLVHVIVYIGYINLITNIPDGNVAEN